MPGSHGKEPRVLSLLLIGTHVDLVFRGGHNEGSRDLVLGPLGVVVNEAEITSTPGKLPAIWLGWAATCVDDGHLSFVFTLLIFILIAIHFLHRRATSEQTVCFLSLCLLIPFNPASTCISIFRGASGEDVNSIFGVMDTIMPFLQDPAQLHLCELGTRQLRCRRHVEASLLPLYLPVLLVNLAGLLIAVLLQDPFIC